MAIEGKSSLKNEMVKWFDNPIEEKELQDFKKGQPKGDNSLLPFFEGGKKRRADLLLNHHIYNKYINFPAMTTCWKQEMIEKFQNRYNINIITKVYQEVIEEMQERKNRYVIESLDEKNDLIGCIARNKKTVIALSSLGIVSLACIAIVGVFFFLQIQIK
ncbi:MAG: hypothetical protein AMS24_03590 [Chlamydiae bacterium SM23_39]|nr:MAG: hypothetical protein AMS24_03590 [Chlamydiae bacterium SM23_39]